MAASMGRDMSRLVGWINRVEWQTVFDRLYSDDVELQRQAVDRIGAWKSRFGEQIPVSIECTTSLVRAQIMDVMGDSADAVQMAYSIAIIRFVNLITGREQTGLKQRPVAVLANQVGLPSWMVDLRHQAVHRFLPSTAILQEGAKQALEWLRMEYWEAQTRKGHLEKEPEGWEAESEIKESVAAALILYQQEQFEVMEDLQKQNGAKNCDESLSALEELLTSNPNARHIAASLLLLDGYLVPTQEQLEFLQITKEYSEGEHRATLLPRKMITFWTPLLRLLHSLNITPLLLASLLKELAKFTQPCNKTATWLQGWAVLIAVEAGRGPTTTQNPGSKRSRSPHSNGGSSKTLFEGCKTIDLPWNDLVEICIEKPNYYTLAVLPKMLWHMTPKPNVSTVKKIKQLCSMVTNQPDKDTDKECQMADKNVNKKQKGNAKNRSSDARAGPSGEDRKKSSDSISLEVQRTQDQVPSPDPGSHSGELSDRQKGGNGQMSKLHSVAELVALVTEKQKESEGLDGVSEQSSTDAKQLRRQKKNPWEKCTGSVSIDWSAYPLGMLPGQPDDPDYFMLNIHERKGKRSSDVLEDPGMNENGKSFHPHWKSPKVSTEECDDYGRISADQMTEGQNRGAHSTQMVHPFSEGGIPAGKFPEPVVQMGPCRKESAVENAEKNGAVNDSKTEQMDVDCVGSDKIMLL